MFSEYTLNKKSNFDSIKVICGSMFSGKTEDLIKRIQKAKLLFLRRNTNYQSVLFITKILYLIEFFFFIVLRSIN